MTVEELIIYGKQFIHSTYAKMLLADLLGMNSLELINHLDKIVEDEKVELYKQKIESLQEEKPIQYVIGNVNFYGNPFLVNENVLIPRFETEELVEHTLDLINQLFLDKNLKGIDLGCGSGCIGITLKKKLPSLEMTLLDISKDALEVAKQNAKNLNTEVSFIENDMLEELEGKFDVIISNPPYIKEEEQIQDIVKNHEPHLALYAGVDGLDYYRKILKEAPNHVNKQFLIAFEIGETQRKQIEDLARSVFPQATIVSRKDMQDRDRMIFIYQK